MRGEFLGFDLSEVKLAAFEREKLLDKKWHLRSERIICYKLAAVVAVSAQIAANVSMFNTAWVHEEETKTAAVISIACTVFVAMLFGADSFLLIWWPKRRYPNWVYHFKRIYAAVITIAMAVIASFITITVMTHETGPDAADQRFPLHNYLENKIWVVALWLAFAMTCVATTLLFIASAHDLEHGPEPRHLAVAHDVHSWTNDRDSVRLEDQRRPY